MTSVVVSDIATDFGRHPHTMMVDDHRDTASPGHGRSRTSSSRSTGSQHQYHASHMVSSSASTPTQQSAGTSLTGPERPATQPPPSSAPFSGPHDGWQTSQQPPGASGNALNSQGLATPPDSQKAGGEEPALQPTRDLDSDQAPPPPRLLPTIRSSLSMSGGNSPHLSKIKVHDLNHIRSFASEEVLTRSRHGSTRSLTGRITRGQQYEISAMPVADIIEMVAGLLTKITNKNDEQGQHLHRQLPVGEAQNVLSAQESSVLSFHGKNVPAITILSYLSRIHKYCPTTYEVFLSLLVYFDRMTENINGGVIHSFENLLEDGISEAPSAGADRDRSPSIDISSPSSYAGSERRDSAFAPGPPSPRSEGSAEQPPFVVDSFNIHRLVIAGVTCASKFFSDVFYTNSRYAKVGGLPIHELNHLELQFLLLNNFQLSIKVEELETYGSMLVEFYAQEVMAQQGQ